MSIFTGLFHSRDNPQNRVGSAFLLLFGSTTSGKTVNERTAMQTTADNIKPNTKKSTEKIDGVVALIMGLARATVLGGGIAESVYAEKGLLIF